MKVANPLGDKPPRFLVGVDQRAETALTVVAIRDPIVTVSAKRF